MPPPPRPVASNDNPDPAAHSRRCLRAAALLVPLPSAILASLAATVAMLRGLAS